MPRDFVKTAEGMGDTWEVDRDGRKRQEPRRPGGRWNIEDIRIVLQKEDVVRPATSPRRSDVTSLVSA